jgi:addiction module HigA family antidote
MHPGVILRELLDNLGITASELAAATGVAEDVVVGIVDFATAIDSETADRLHTAFGVSAEFWLNAQRLYEEGLARGATDVSGDYR